MKIFYNLLVLTFLTIVLGSCKSSDTKEAKMSFTVTGVDPNDDDTVEIIISGYENRNKIKTPFKVNGTVRNNEQQIVLSKQDFVGATKTYNIESLEELDVISVTIMCQNYGKSFTINYKIEINGEVLQNEKNLSVEENVAYFKNFDY